MSIRRVVSLTALISFAVLSYTGLMLFIGPQGRIAYWTGWRFLGLSKEQYGELHTTFMVLFVVAAVWHTVLNWKVILGYLRDRARRIKVFTPEFTVAAVLGLTFFLGTLFRVTPFDEFLAFEDGLKDYWEESSGSPPWGHAEQNSLDRFVRGLVDWERLENQRAVHFETSEALATLRTRGYAVRDEKQRLIDIAQANGTTPQALMSLVLATGRATDAPSGSDGPDYPRPVSGLGKMSLREYSDKYGVELDALLQALAKEGMKVDPDRALRTEAGRWDMDPESLLDLGWTS